MKNSYYLTVSHLKRQVKGMKTLTYFAAVFLLICLRYNAYARVLVVPDDFPAIQKAINAASVGDTVFVKAGKYRESIKLKSGIKLLGAGIGKTILLPKKEATSQIILGKNVKDVTISAVTIDGRQKADSGIYLIASEAEVRECEVTALKSGIVIADQSTAEVINNTILKNETGIKIHLSEARVRHNKVIECELGISCSKALPKITVNRNTLRKCKTGISIAGGTALEGVADEIVIKDNIIDGEDISSYGISLGGDNTPRVLEGNIIKNCLVGIEGRLAKFEAKYNLIINSHRPFNPWRSEAQIINNTIYKCKWIGITCVGGSIDVQNNIFASCESAAIGLDNTEAKIVNNDFFDMPAILIYQQGPTIESIKELNKIKNCNGNVYVDPRFIAPEEGNFQLHYSSPVKDMGTFPISGRVVCPTKKSITIWGEIKK